eukprot:CAMPEP_0114273126 /NCGR_PEP_ID=MMETSP0058-20121206/28925_1 /TAXON_ID=36894 /ORGANISM="Pyramimonas parkeae, CCMP726" /LENGTH=332 /DNA_ID=CAMNT_0001392549 /DNA_START=119 /DNA_END=1117 /DNA_ORIENTATION=+
MRSPARGPTNTASQGLSLQAGPSIAELQNMLHPEVITGTAINTVNDLWTRMAAVGYDVFHYNRICTMGTAQAVDILSFVMVLLALCSLIKYDIILEDTHWSYAKVQDGDWVWPEKYQNRIVEDVYFGISSVMFVDGNNEVVSHVTWGDLGDDESFVCDQECMACVDSWEGTRVPLYIATAIQGCNMYATGFRKLGTRDTHFLKLFCTACAFLAVFFNVTSMTNFRVKCGLKPPETSEGFGPTGVTGQPVNFEFKFGLGYVGLLMSTVFSFFTMLMHAMTPSAKLYDLDKYQVNTDLSVAVPTDPGMQIEGLSGTIKDEFSVDMMDDGGDVAN